ncbi:MAG: peptidoglycan-binding domain-containing protein, partial [Acidimicrobiaceae bacterium]
PDAGCAHTRLFHLENNTWVNTASCQRTLPLTRYAMSCYIPNVGAATLAQLPPSDVACLIWPANTLLKHTAETGCTPSKADIIAQMNGACTGYYDAVGFPVEKCDQGRAVRLMQERLKKAGYNTNVDGYFGPSMAKAVYDFQGTAQLQQTGMIDQATWLALEPNQSSLPGTDANSDGVVGPNELK